ncbi:MAG: hypothetical protein JEZ07_13200 [Phycisphaerae bacterium]|nr:hypothetical protein [Phycisphaerae bacterium]
MQSGKIDQIVLIAFNFEVVKKSKELMADVPAYWLVSAKKDKTTNEYLPLDPELVVKVKEDGIDGLDVYYKGIDEKFMVAVRDAGQDLYVWTVDDPAEAKRLIKLGVRGITTNRPEWLKNQVNNSN